MLSGFQRRSLMSGLLAVGIAGVLSLYGCGAERNPTSRSEIVVTSAADALDSPLDAIPDPTGATIYFLATGTTGKGVFKVPAAGGTVSEIFSGAPFVDPHGLGISTDGATLFVADRGADGGKGGVYSLPVNGDLPALVAGTDGSHASAIDIVSEGKADRLYFTGTDADGKPAVLSIPTSGGAATVLASGDPLGSPDGLAVASDGVVYVTDKAPAGGGAGRVFTIDGGVVEVLVDDLIAGDPAGTALTLDERTLLVSSIDVATGTSQVLLVDLTNNKTSSYNKVIKVNKVSGGLHRALSRNDFAWAGKTSVYSVKIVKVAFDSSAIAGPGD